MKRFFSKIFYQTKVIFELARARDTTTCIVDLTVNKITGPNRGKTRDRGSKELLVRVAVNRRYDSTKISHGPARTLRKTMSNY